MNILHKLLLMITACLAGAAWVGGNPALYWVAGFVFVLFLASFGLFGKQDNDLNVDELERNYADQFQRGTDQLRLKQYQDTHTRVNSVSRTEGIDSTISMLNEFNEMMKSKYGKMIEGETTREKLRNAKIYDKPATNEEKKWMREG